MRTKIRAGERYLIPMHGETIVEVESVDAAFVKFFVVRGPELYTVIPLFVPLGETRKWKKVQVGVAGEASSVKLGVFKRGTKWLTRKLGKLRRGK